MKPVYFALFLLLLLGLPIGHAAAQSGGDFDITSYTIDGGGGTANGGNYDLNGTVGQADTMVTSGGDFSLSQGYWQIENSPITTSVHFNTANTQTNPTTLLFIVMMVLGGVLLTIQLRTHRV